MVKALGLMSGTSMDGIDVALLESDGEGILHPGPGLTIPYDSLSRKMLSAAIAQCISADGAVFDKALFAPLETHITDLHVRAVECFAATFHVDLKTVDVVGFHGHTILHRPDLGFTWQIGNGSVLAQRLGCDVVHDFRSLDVAAGGEGAPLLPIYHRAIAQSLNFALPSLFINLGGVGNITWVVENDTDLLAFDTGPANALIDDWVNQHLGISFDQGGKIAARGLADEGIIQNMLSQDFFLKKPPKSLDRNDFKLNEVQSLNIENGAATLTAFSAACVAQAFTHLPERPQKCIVVGGGRHNPTLMRELSGRTGLVMESLDEYGFNGDFVEAQGFAYMAIRCLRELPISYPGTTGVPGAMTGGMIVKGGA